MKSLRTDFHYIITEIAKIENNRKNKIDENFNTGLEIGVFRFW